jgi:hypothetical protein
LVFKILLVSKTQQFKNSNAYRALYVHVTALSSII